MDKQIRIHPDSHKALKKYAAEHHMSIRSSANIAVNALYPSIVVALDTDGRIDIIEVYTNEREAVARIKELEKVFPSSRLFFFGRFALPKREKFRKYGHEWIEATGWTPTSKDVDIELVEPPKFGHAADHTGMTLDELLRQRDILDSEIEIRRAAMDSDDNEKDNH